MNFGSAQRQKGLADSPTVSCNVILTLNDNVKFLLFPLIGKSRGNLFSTATCYGLEDWDSRVRFPTGVGKFYLFHRV